jgi:hypothetical protein
MFLSNVINMTLLVGLFDGHRIKKMIAATNIQRGWRQYMGRVGPRRNKAATDIQRHWRGYKGRGWVHFMQNQEWYQINQVILIIMINITICLYQ